MRIGIISDLHGYPYKFKKALMSLGDCHMILCAGDILYHGPRNPILDGYDPQGLAEAISKNETPMLIARGNCDAEVDLMVLKLPIYTPAVIYEIDGIRFMVMHGHDVNQEKLREIARIYKVDIMVTGHTHIRSYEVFSDTLFINPGSIGVPKGDGISSAAIYEKGIVKFINIENGEELKNF
ncbi:MAG: phosphodiesterase [Clostridiales bacterium]|jgi:putative phosphoesterase|nr:phosphodiesterase [Clostridiales bacterium]